MYIKSILSQFECGEHPNSFKTLNSSLQFSYYDYIEAWHAIFLHQTEDFSHSWFIIFDSKFKSPFPYWFSSWWEIHGPTIDLLPFSLKESVKYFFSKYKFKQESQFFPKLLIFIAKYKVPGSLNGPIKSIGNHVF
ncbi:unnamed protein product [Prunus brigantina]